MSLGYDHESFWDQTSRTVALTFEASRLRATREHNERMHLAWHTAALMRTQKQFPKLNRLMQQNKTRNRRQSMAKQIAIARMWSALGYGKMKKVN